MPSSTPTPTPSPSLSSRAIATWDANAAHWDTTITKHGNKYWRRLQEPSLARLLGPALSNSKSDSQTASPQPSSCRALDLATGNGLCARWLARRGARSVLATDASEGMLARARGHSHPSGAGGGGEEETEEKVIRWRRVDVTSRADLAALGREEGKFDVVLMNMALMDVAELEPLAEALPRLLAAGGVFVATVLHPVFFTSNASRHLEVRFDPATGEAEVVRGKMIREYMAVPPALGIAVPGQPEKQLYFHRPMHELFAPFFRAGLVMDAMEELAFTAEDAEARIESSSNYTQLPAILSFRMRLA